MGRKLDLSSLTEEEAQHVLQVVQRDVQLRKAEEQRLRELKQEQEQEESRCSVLSRQRGFNERCCMRCCSPFGFLLAPRHTCLGCGHHVCRRCCLYARDGWLCSACQRTRLLKIRSLEWFYSSVSRRFKRFGSDKVLKILCRRLTTWQDSPGEFTGGSTCDESSISASDSTFYRHSKEHSVAETTSVARRVAEDTVDEAIAKSQSQTHSEQKLKEAQYLQDNRGELITELTTVIVQKIIRRRWETSEVQPERPADGSSEPGSPSSPGGQPHSFVGSGTSLSTSLWRSQSALALHTEDGRDQEGKAERGHVFPADCMQGLKKDGAAGPALPSWKSVDRLDSSSASMLQSPDGNWIAMQSSQLSRPSLLSKRKSLVFTALEKESGAVSAYDGLGSDTEPDTHAAWGAALLEFRQKAYSTSKPCSPKTLAETPSENTQTDVGHDMAVFKPHKGQFPVMKRRVAREHRRPSVLDMNFSPDGTGSSEDSTENSRARRTRRKRRSRRGRAEESGFTSLSSSEVDYSRMLLEVLTKHQSKRQAEVINNKPLDDASDTATSDTATPDDGSSGAVTPGAVTPGSVTPGAPEEEEPLTGHGLLTESLGHQLTSTLVQLTGPFSEMKDELDKEEEMVGEANVDREVRTGEMWAKEAGKELEEAGRTERGVERREGKKKETREGESTVCSGLGANLAPPALQVHKSRVMHTIDRESVNSGTRELNREVTPDLHDETAEKQSENQADRSGRRQTDRGQTGRGQTDCTDHEQVKDQSSTEVETQQELKCQSDSKLKKLRQTSGEGAEEESERAPERWKETVKNRFDELDLTRSEEEAEYKRMVDSVVQALDNMEREIGADTCDPTSAVPAETREEEDEEQKDEKGMTWLAQMEESVKVQQDKQMSVADPVQGRTLGQECVTEAEEYRDHTFKEDRDSALSGQEFLSPEEIYKKYSAASLSSITTEVLKVLNATEDLIRGSMGAGLSQSERQDLRPLPPAQSKRLDEQLSHLEENVYVAASAAFGLEVELEELAECARSVGGSTSEGELAHLEEQVASAAAQVQQAELQVTDIAARIAALKNAGLNVAPQTQKTQKHTGYKPLTHLINTGDVYQHLQAKRKSPNKGQS